MGVEVDVLLVRGQWLPWCLLGLSGVVFLWLRRVGRHRFVVGMAVWLEWPFCVWILMISALVGFQCTVVAGMRIGVRIWVGGIVKVCISASMCGCQTVLVSQDWLFRFCIVRSCLQSISMQTDCCVGKGAIGRCSMEESSSSAQEATESTSRWYYYVCSRRNDARDSN